MAQENGARKLGEAFTQGAEGIFAGLDYVQRKKLQEKQLEIQGQELEETKRRNTAQIISWEDSGLLSKAQAAELHIKNEVSQLFLEAATGPSGEMRIPTDAELTGPWDNLTPNVEVVTENILDRTGGLEPGSLGYKMYGDLDEAPTTPAPTGTRRRQPAVERDEPVSSWVPFQLERPAKEREDPHFYGPGQPLLAPSSPQLVRPLPGPTSPGVELTLEGDIGRPSPEVELTLRSDIGRKLNISADTAERFVNAIAAPGVPLLPPPGQRPQEIVAREKALQALQDQAELQQKPRMQAVSESVGDVPLYENTFRDPETGQTLTMVRTAPTVARSLAEGGSEVFRNPMTGAQQERWVEIAPTVQSLANIERLLPLVLARNASGFGEEGGIGPISGNISKLRTMLPGWLGMDDKLFNDLNVGIATLLNNTVRMITGAQMSNPEAKRIGLQIPAIENRPSVFKAKLEATKANIRAMIASNQMEISLEDYYFMSPHVWRPEGIEIEPDAERNAPITVSGLRAGAGFTEPGTGGPPTSPQGTDQAMEGRPNGEKDDVPEVLVNSYMDRR